MTSFTYPLQIKRLEEAQSGAGAVRARVRGVFAAKVSVGQTGAGPGVTTIPLFVVPAGSIFSDCVIDVLTGFNLTDANANVRIGVPTSTGILFAATSVVTAGRRTQTASAAQVSAWAVSLTADTTVEALVSIDTSAATTGEILVRVFVE